jgi:hypothetical protein
MRPQQSAQPQLLLAAIAGQELRWTPTSASHGGNEGAYSEARWPTPPRQAPARGAWSEGEVALDLRFAADLRSVPGHNGPSYKSIKPRLPWRAGTSPPPLPTGNTGERASDRAMANENFLCTVARSRGWEGEILYSQSCCTHAPTSLA